MWDRERVSLTDINNTRKFIAGFACKCQVSLSSLRSYALRRFIPMAVKVRRSIMLITLESIRIGYPSFPRLRVLLGHARFGQDCKLAISA